MLFFDETCNVNLPHIVKSNVGVMHYSCLGDVSDLSGVGKTSVVEGQDAVACLQQLLVETDPEINQNFTSIFRG